VVLVDLRSPLFVCGDDAPSGKDVGTFDDVHSIDDAPSDLTVAGKVADKVEVVNYGELDIVSGVLLSSIDESASGASILLTRGGK
jgi:hypothetical protein